MKVVAKFLFGCLAVVSCVAEAQAQYPGCHNSGYGAMRHAYPRSSNYGAYPGGYQGYPMQSPYGMPATYAPPMVGAPYSPNYSVGGWPQPAAPNYPSYYSSNTYYIQPPQQQNHPWHLGHFLLGN